MNRRSFLAWFGKGALAAALDLVDPDKLLWVPGAKTIIDFGATKRIEAPTDAQMAQLFTEQLRADRGHTHARSDVDDILNGPRDIRLDLNGVSFHFRREHGVERLVSHHSAKQLAWLGRPFLSEALRTAPPLTDIGWQLDDATGVWFREDR